MRQTLSEVLTREGVGLRSGERCLAQVAPGPSGAGITLNGVPIGPAIIDDTISRATGLVTPTGTVAVVEHLLAALALAEVDDACIQVKGPELPILDGSAAQWLVDLKTCVQPGARQMWRIEAPITVEADDRRLTATPAERPTLEVAITLPPEMPSEVAMDGVQRARWAPRQTEIAQARTWGFLAEREHLAAAGLLGGVSLETVLVIDESGQPLNPSGYRLVNELAAHKLLDLMGDLALLGAPLLAHVEGWRPGHALNHDLERAVWRQGVLIEVPDGPI